MLEGLPSLRGRDFGSDLVAVRGDGAVTREGCARRLARRPGEFVLLGGRDDEEGCTAGPYQHAEGERSKKETAAAHEQETGQAIASELVGGVAQLLGAGTNLASGRVDREGAGQGVNGINPAVEKAYSEAYTTWKVAHSRVTIKMQAYFTGEAKLVQAWEGGFYDSAQGFLMLSSSGLGDRRAGVVSRFREWADGEQACPQPTPENWALLGRDRNDSGEGVDPPFKVAYEQLADHLECRAGRLASAVLATRDVRSPVAG